MQTLDQIAYDTGRSALADQESLVAGIRQRTGTLLAAHALVASFLGGATNAVPILSFDRSETGRHRFPFAASARRTSGTWRNVVIGVDAGAKIRGMFDDAVIQEAGRRILEAAPPDTRLILFGSHARGEAGRHSDLDFLVIEPSVEDWGRESVRLRSTLNGMLIPADIIVVSEESVREWRDVYGTVIHAALAEGRELAA